MAYIAPNSTIKLLRNVPLEKDYINTLYFASASAQATYFNSTAKYTLTAQSYQRANKGVCRVNYKVEDLYDCNYMMFQNTSFGTKWFYAFITSVDYVNNVTSDVHYEIDVMQTWAFEMSLTQCFVEREHSATDNIGDNLVAEPVDIGEVVFNYYTKISAELDKYAILMVVAKDTESAPSAPISGNVINKVFTGCKIFVTAPTSLGVTELNAKLQIDYAQYPDNVLALYMCPVLALPKNPIDQYGQTSPYWLTDDEYQSLVQNCKEYSLGGDGDYAISGTQMLDGYLPKNKKLYTYPYNFLHVDNANGRELNLRFEYFNDGNGHPNLKPMFKLTLNCLQPVVTVLRPMNYKGITSLNGGDADHSPNQTDCTESIDLVSYPMCNWNVDSYNAWIAQNSIPESVSVLSSVAGLGVTAALVASGVGSVGALAAGAGATVIGSASKILTNHYRASIEADVCKGSLNNANVNVGSKKQNFFVGRMSVNKFNAAIIDDFFNRFGYATNRVKTPNTHSRPHWNYVKTIGSNIGGSIPSDDKKTIDDIFNNGITFWKNASEVDNYSLNNAPT